MASRPTTSGLQEEEICFHLNDSELDLSDEDDVETTVFQNNNSDDSYSGSANSSDTEELSRPGSGTSLGSSIYTATRGRTRIRGGPRTRGGRSRGRIRTRGGRGQTEESPLSATNSWTGTFSPLAKPNFQPRYNLIDTDTWSEEDYFKQYVNDNILEQMVDATNRTYLVKHGIELKLTLKELKSFIGVLLIMGSITLPKIRMYWSKRYGVQIIKDTMPRARFFSIRSSLKVVVDGEVSELDRANKIWKVAPLFDAILKGCHGQPREDHISIDEMIIPFSGHCGIRQYCPGKPNPVGIKVFALANPNGLICDMVVYQGDTTFPELKAQGFTLGESAILQLSETLVPGHHLYFDRYFTTIKLVETLLERGFHGTGTIQRNRIPRTCQFSPEKEFTKKDRGTSETLARADGTIAITRWLDNKPVLIVSTVYAASSPDQCRRWSKRNKRYEMVSRPEVIKYYNQYMGGVDMADRMLAVCPARSRTKKWTLRFITHMVDLAICNAWFQYREHQKQCHVPANKIPQLRDFRLALGEIMVTKNSLSSDSDSCSDFEDLAPKHRNRKVEVKPVPAESFRFHKAEHLVAYSTVQNRCRKPKCSMTTTAYCIKCCIFLCSTRKRNCFLEFHQKI